MRDLRGRRWKRFDGLNDLNARTTLVAPLKFTLACPHADRVSAVYDARHRFVDSILLHVSHAALLLVELRASCVATNALRRHFHALQNPAAACDPTTSSLALAREAPLISVVAGHRSRVRPVVHVTCAGTVLYATSSAGDVPGVG